MTERGQGRVLRSREAFEIGPSALSWDGRSLLIEVDEIGLPLPRRVRGRIRVWPQGLCDFVTPLDGAGRHRWGPIAPCARVEVDLEQPGQRWRGHAYLDSNEGDEPIDRPFRSWDWCRASLRDGSTGVIYDVRPKIGPDRVIAERFRPDGSHEPFEAPPRQALPTTLWRIDRHMRSADGPAPPARVRETLEDTPFYQRALVDAHWFGEPVTAVHESLDVPRLVAPTTRLMLPFRMPRLR
jgi:carotenoid 1,2-hydratase